MGAQNVGLPIGRHEHVLNIARQFRTAAPKKIVSYGNGGINETYLVEIPDGDPNRWMILQMLHPVFKISVLEDMWAITTRLLHRGMMTPFLIPSRPGNLYVKEDDRYWRMLSYIPGVSYEHAPDAPTVESAAGLLGRFHRETAELQREFKHVIPGFHNTPRIMRRLYELSHRFKNTMRYDALAVSLERVLGAYSYLAPTIPALPRRVLHGDPKFSNIRFDEGGAEAIALLDLDTLGRGPIIIDLGDAIRSWCHVSEKKFGKKISAFSLSYFEAFLRGYFSEAPALSKEEKNTVIEGAELLMLELSARFLTDAFEENYFKLDSEKYPNLFEQNRARAAGELALYDDLQDKRSSALALLRQYTS